MKCIIKLFPEITIKSKSVRLHFIRILINNIRIILKSFGKSIILLNCWDCIELDVRNDDVFLQQITTLLVKIPGIHYVLLVKESYFNSMRDIFEATLLCYSDVLKGKSFCVRVKRCGNHGFTSHDVECYLGKLLIKNIEGTYVKLVDPEKIVLIEIKGNKLLLVLERYNGLGGFPIGTQHNVLSLISGGFDSSVSSYMLIRRGCRVNYCFFNFGGTTHEIGVRNVVYHLWSNFSSSHNVRFVSIDFLPVINEILKNVHDSYIGLVLKRMMIRVASKMAVIVGAQALVTGEVLGQVSSQTMFNLKLIDDISDMLIFRPLIAYDKEQIIHLSRCIGTENLSNLIPEYCGILSKNPVIRASKYRLDKEEVNFNFSILQQVISEAKVSYIFKDCFNSTLDNIDLSITSDLNLSDVVLDIRSYVDQERKPLCIKNKHVEIKSLPFYKLDSHFSNLDQSKIYLLYCEKSTMSKLHALYLLRKGFKNIKVFCPGYK